MTAATLDDLVAVLLAGAHDTEAGGERAGFTLLEHGLQCADHLRRRHPDDVELQVAGLVHDIGHTLTGADDDVHGRAAADFVQPLLGDRVARLVELHVPAKRYLVATDPAYGRRLSPASRSSLAVQGAAMATDEVATFELLPGWKDAVALRWADDDAKDPNARPAPLADWLTLLESLAQRVHAGHVDA